MAGSLCGGWHRIPFVRSSKPMNYLLTSPCRDFKLNFHLSASLCLPTKDFRIFTEFESLKGLTLTPMVSQVYLLSVCLGPEIIFVLN